MRRRPNRDDKAVATGLRRGKTFFLYSAAGDRGLSFASPPCRVVAMSAPDEELAAALRDVVAGFTPIDTTTVSEAARARWHDEILAAAGVGSWSALERNAKLVEIGVDAHTWTFTPMRRRHGGWIRFTDDDSLPLTSPRRTPWGAGDAELAGAFRAAIAGPTPSA